MTRTTARCVKCGHAWTYDRRGRPRQRRQRRDALDRYGLAPRPESGNDGPDRQDGFDRQDSFDRQDGFDRAGD